ncbi:hypothetical protein BJX96DRAFT_136384 [Aspergillus floccosus]
MSRSPHHHVHSAQSLQLGPRHPVADTKYDQLASLKSPEHTSSSLSPINVTVTATSGSKHPADIRSEISATALNTVPSIDLEARSLHPSDALSDYSTKQVSESQRVYTQLNTRRETDRQEIVSNTLAPNVHRDPHHLVTEPLSSSHGILGQKRTAAGVIKQPTDMRRDSPSSGVDAAERRRARSISALPHGSRIAALSVHLRTRLSYAAAKVEKNRQSHDTRTQLPLEFLTRELPTTSANMVSSVKVECSPNSFGTAGQRLMELDSPDGTTVSAPDPPGFFSLHAPTRASPVARSDGNSPFSLHGDPPSPQKSHRLLPVPKLAPPADIVPSSSNTRRRRPNPNGAGNTHSYAPLSRHRRHHSQQDVRTSQSNASSETVLVPGTPPLGPTAYTSTPYNGTSSQQTQSQNTSMEQDAIETLLFMSSPENSGYRSNSQNSQTRLNPIRNNIAASLDIANSAPWSQNSQQDTNSSQSTQLSTLRGPSNGLEAHAGDEIDRMLDQMDSDSEDESKPPARYSNVKTSSVTAESSLRRNVPPG